MDEPLKKVTIHTDGGCDGNPGPGGWAAVLAYGERVKEISGGEVATTNNRMELKAAIEALRALRERCVVELHTDSEYLRNGITKWVHGWRKRGWMRTATQPVKNAELWRELDELARGHEIAWRWVRGHTGDVNNERCDRLAAAEIAKIKREIPAEKRKELLAQFIAERAPEKDQKRLFE
jgi:ribonuclease HI